MVVTLAACSLLCAIGLTTIAVFDKEMPNLTGYAQSANTTMYTTFNNVYSAFSLSAVIPIVAIVAVLVSLMFCAFFAFKKSNVWTIEDGKTQ